MMSCNRGLRWTVALAAVAVLSVVAVPTAHAEDAVAGEPCPPRLKPVCVEREVVIPAVTRQVRVPEYETVHVPVYARQCTQLFRDVEVPVYATRDVPVYRCVNKPVYADVQVPVYDWREIPVMAARQVPITREVCDPCTGETRVVQCGCRAETVQTGTRMVRCHVGWETETYQCGVRRERYQCGTQTRQRLAGWRTEQVPCGTRCETYQCGTETKQVPCGVQTDVVQTGTRQVCRFKGWRCEERVVCPERTQTVRELVMVPVSDTVPAPSAVTETPPPMPAPEAVPAVETETIEEIPVVETEVIEEVPAPGR